MPHLNPNWNCSYAYWRVGQYAKFAGYEGALMGASQMVRFMPMLVTAAGTAVGNTSGWLGKNLSIHPACGALAEFDEQILPWKGIPQGYAIEDLHDEGILYEGAMVPLEMTMSMTTLVGPELIRLAESFDQRRQRGPAIEWTL